MTTRRKPGTVRKKPAALRAKATASRARASAVTSRRSSSPQPIVFAAFPAECTIAQAADVKTQLESLLGKPASVTLDLDGIRRIDTAGLQVLIAFIRERRSAGREVECAGASAEFLATAEVLGLRALFSRVGDDRSAVRAAGHA